MGGEKASGKAKWAGQREGTAGVLCGLGWKRDNRKGGEADLAQVPRGEGGVQRGRKEAPELVK